MKSINEIIDDLLEIFHSIKEQLFGFGYEDFRINRKLKIDITNEILKLIEIYKENINNYPDIIPIDDLNHINAFINQMLGNQDGINELLIWNFCKKNLYQYEKSITKYQKEISKME